MVVLTTVGVVLLPSVAPRESGALGLCCVLQKTKHMAEEEASLEQLEGEGEGEEDAVCTRSLLQLRSPPRLPYAARMLAFAAVLLSLLLLRAAQLSAALPSHRVWHAPPLC